MIKPKFKSSLLTEEKISCYYHLPIAEAAKCLSVCPTLLKGVCREMGISRWPYRQIQSLKTMIEKMKALLPKLPLLDQNTAGAIINDLLKKHDLILSDPRVHNQPLHQQRKDFRKMYKKICDQRTKESSQQCVSIFATQELSPATFVTPAPNYYPLPHMIRLEPRMSANHKLTVIEPRVFLCATAPFLPVRLY